jgi:hypothetical protein
MNPLNFSPGGKSPRAVLKKLSGSPATVMDLGVSASPSTDVFGRDAHTFSH